MSTSTLPTAPTFDAATASRTAIIENAIRGNRSKVALLALASDFRITARASWPKDRVIAALRGVEWDKPAPKSTRADGEPTTAALRAKIKARIQAGETALKGYSGLNRAQLVEAARTGVCPKRIVSMIRRDGEKTTAALKAELKARVQAGETALKGYSTLNRQECVDALKYGKHTGHTYGIGSIGWFRDTMRSLTLPGRSKLDRAGMAKAIAEAGYGQDLIDHFADCPDRNRDAMAEALRAAGLSV